MSWLDVDTQNCSVQRTLDVIGEKWTLLLIRDAANGVHRFQDFRRHVGLSEAVLTDRLRTLVGNGLFKTRSYQEPGQRQRQEYRLTEKGWDLLPVLISLMQWGDDHAADDTGGPWRVQHVGCGHPVRAVVQCTHDGQTLTHRDTEAVPGPSAHPASGRPESARTASARSA
jgi:DNA-binding HxlR family transcriptional regulator